LELSGPFLTVVAHEDGGSVGGATRVVPLPAASEGEGGTATRPKTDSFFNVEKVVENLEKNDAAERRLPNWVCPLAILGDKIKTIAPASLRGSVEQWHWDRYRCSLQLMEAVAKLLKMKCVDAGQAQTTDEEFLQATIPQCCANDTSCFVHRWAAAPGKTSIDATSEGYLKKLLALDPPMTPFSAESYKHLTIVHPAAFSLNLPSKAQMRKFVEACFPANAAQDDKSSCAICRQLLRNAARGKKCGYDPDGCPM